eukprot:5880239-Pyramimonas_sp.AAC.1
MLECEARSRLYRAEDSPKAGQEAPVLWHRARVVSADAERRKVEAVNDLLHVGHERVHGHCPKMPRQRATLRDAQENVQDVPGSTLHHDEGLQHSAHADV